MSADGTGLFIIFLIAIAMIIYVRVQAIPIRLICSFTWFLPMAYLTSSPPTSLPAGSPGFTIILVITIGIALITGFWAFRRPLQVNTTKKNSNGEVKNEGYESNQWHLPTFMQGGESEEKQVQEARKAREERREAYRERFRKALNPDERED